MDELSPNLADPLTTQFAEWRLPATTREPQAADFGSSAPIYQAAWVGTALAGGLFPAVLFVAVLLFAGPPRNVLGQAFIFVLMGGVVGLIWAAVVGVLVFLVVGLIQWLASLYPWRTMMASIAGGWTGVVATQLTVGRGFRGNDYDLTGLILTWVAMAMGQIGAWRFAHRQKQKMAVRRRPEPKAQPRFTIRQLLGMTTATAILAAVISALRLPTAVHFALASSMAFQALGVVLYYFVTRRDALESANEEQRARAVFVGLGPFADEPHECAPFEVQSRRQGSPRDSG